MLGADRLDLRKSKQLARGMPPAQVARVRAYRLPLSHSYCLPSLLRLPGGFSATRAWLLTFCPAHDRTISPCIIRKLPFARCASLLVAWRERAAGANAVTLPVSLPRSARHLPLLYAVRHSAHRGSAVQAVLSPVADRCVAAVYGMDALRIYPGLAVVARCCGVALQAARAWRRGVAGIFCLRNSLPASPPGSLAHFAAAAWASRHVLGDPPEGGRSAARSSLTSLWRRRATCARYLLLRLSATVRKRPGVAAVAQAATCASGGRTGGQAAEPRAESCSCAAWGAWHLKRVVGVHVKFCNLVAAAACPWRFGRAGWAATRAGTASGWNGRI